MSPKENKALVRQLIEAWHEGGVAELSRFWAPDMVHHGRGGETMPAASVAGEMGRFMSAFPDLRIEVDGMVAEDDMVATRLTVRCTHTGSYLGIAPTGKKVSCALMGQLRIRDGRIVEHWGVADGLHLLQQLGLLPDDLLAATA